MDNKRFWQKAYLISLKELIKLGLDDPNFKAKTYADKAVDHYWDNFEGELNKF